MKSTLPDSLQRHHDVAPPGVSRRLIAIPGPTCGVRRLLAGLQRRRDGKTIRDRAIIRLLFDLALHRGELVGLALEPLDLDAGIVAVLGKGDGEREQLTLPHEPAAALRAGIEVRRRSQDRLFTNFDRADKGRRPTATSVYRMGTPARRARPHDLRYGVVRMKGHGTTDARQRLTSAAPARSRALRRHTRRPPRRALGPR
jgi:integrase